METIEFLQGLEDSITKKEIIEMLTNGKKLSEYIAYPF